ncbi:hypothetical protein OUZ56_015863 [Daphnia magna]|uniref:Uncharacterized protein n=1 Tax=Daphnia magna TaxID=35525 RepID=A0ABR0AP21_9CRUS|nr:hypothetical protein OUZ56_015863 [Daphnia magna]
MTRNGADTISTSKAVSILIRHLPRKSSTRTPLKLNEPNLHTFLYEGWRKRVKSLELQIFMLVVLSSWSKIKEQVELILEQSRFFLVNKDFIHTQIMLKKSSVQFLGKKDMHQNKNFLIITVTKTRDHIFTFANIIEPCTTH